MVVMSGDVGCWCALFGNLVGVSVLSVMWLELESIHTSQYKQITQHP